MKNTCPSLLLASISICIIALEFSQWEHTCTGDSISLLKFSFDAGWSCSKSASWYKVIHIPACSCPWNVPTNIIIFGAGQHSHLVFVSSSTLVTTFSAAYSGKFWIQFRRTTIPGITGKCHCLMLICEVQVKSAQQCCANFIMRHSDDEKKTTVKIAPWGISFYLYFCTTTVAMLKLQFL